jgi:hypothetical protein
METNEETDAPVPEEHADESSGAGGADSPEDVAADQDAGPTETAEQAEEAGDRDQAEG